MHVSAPNIDPKVLLSADLVDELFEHFRQMAPIQKWLVQLDKKVLVEKV